MRKSVWMNLICFGIMHCFLEKAIFIITIFFLRVDLLMGFFRHRSVVKFS